MSASADPPAAIIDLWLFIAASTPRSMLAYDNLRSICQEHLSGRYHIEVIDLVADPAQASIFDVVAIPTLLKRGPGPPRRVIGDLSDPLAVLAGLDLAPGAPAPAA